MKMWALINKDGQNFSVRFQQDEGNEFGGTYIAKQTLEKMVSTFPAEGWRMELQDK